jgi:hypothetical protein
MEWSTIVDRVLGIIELVLIGFIIEHNRIINSLSQLLVTYGIICESTL